MAQGAVHAVRQDLDAIGATISAAFADDPVQRWLFAGAADPDDARSRFLRFFVDEYFPLGHVYTVSGHAGAALWAPPDRDVLHGPSVEDLLAMVTDAIGDEAMPRLMELARSAPYRPTEPHFYLGVLGVAPLNQGAGLGQILLEPVLAACDQGGFVAHLESSNPRNHGFYQRLGFEVVDDFRCGGGDGPLMTIMRRRPR